MFSHPYVLDAGDVLAEALIAQGRQDEAAAELKNVVALRLSISGHRSVIRPSVSLINLGADPFAKRLRSEYGRWADQLWRQTVE